VDVRRRSPPQPRRATGGEGRKSRTTARNRVGSVRYGKCPAPGKTSSLLLGIARWASSAWVTGMTGSRSPHTSSTGNPSGSWLRSSMLIIWPCQSTTERNVRRKARCRPGPDSASSAPVMSRTSTPVRCRAVARRRPLHRSAARTAGTCTSASSPSPPGSAISRSNWWTFRVTPPGATRINRSTRCGNW